MLSINISNSFIREKVKGNDRRLRSREEGIPSSCRTSGIDCRLSICRLGRELVAEQAGKPSLRTKGIANVYKLLGKRLNGGISFHLQ